MPERKRFFFSIDLFPYASFDLFVFNKSESFDAVMVAIGLSNVHNYILNKQSISKTQQ